MIEKILKEIKEERKSQNMKWGIGRNLTASLWLTILMKEVGEVAKACLEGYKNNYREELIQIAAVAVVAIEHLDSQYNDK